MIAAFKYTLLAMVVGITVIAGGNTVIASGNGSALVSDLVQIDGSSTVFPITEAMAEKFQKAEGGKTNVTVRVSGTAAGFMKFCRGETDISNASRPIEESELALCKENGVKYIELPIALDALTVVNNSKNTWVDHLIVWKGGASVEPSVENAKTGTYQPLSRPIFIYVSKKSIESKPYVNRFVEFYLDNGNAKATIKEEGYVPLPEKAYDMVTTSS